MSQMNPLIGPVLNQRSLFAVKKFWVSSFHTFWTGWEHVSAGICPMGGGGFLCSAGGKDLNKGPKTLTRPQKPSKHPQNPLF